MIQAYVLLGTLGVHSVEDIREKKISVTITLFSGIVGIILHLLFQNQSIYAMLAGMLPGIFAFFWVTIRHGKKNEKIPLIPFLFAGYSLMMWI